MNGRAAQRPAIPLPVPVQIALRGLLLAGLVALGVLHGGCMPAEPREPTARNVIVFVGDGMGIATVTAAGILQGQLRGEPGEGNQLSFERFGHVALSKTYTADHQVGDSAATMTAMMTGEKTRSGLIATSAAVHRGQCDGADAARLTTLLQEAGRRGLATGLVTNTRVTHATPAATYAHSPERLWESDADMPDAALQAGCRDIARQLVELAPGIDVVLGGGWNRFLPAQSDGSPHRGHRRDGRNLIRQWQQTYPDGHYLWRGDQLLALDPAGTAPVLGLFAPSHLSYAIERNADVEPSLAELTAFAIRRLAHAGAGYLLVVEGGLIDHAHHGNNAHRALHETIALADAVEAALALIDRDETLVIVTADHSHTLTFSGFPVRGNPMLGLVRNEHGEPVADAAGRPYTTLGYASGPGAAGESTGQPAGPKTFPHWPEQFDAAPAARPDLADVDTQAPDFLQEALVPLTSATHGGEDVPVYADGPGAARVRGVIEQHRIHGIVREAFGW